MELKENHVLIGIGGTGGNILKAFRKRLYQELPPDVRSKLPIGYVYVDSSQEMMNPQDQTWKVLGENSQLGQDSFLYVRSAKLSDQLDNVENFPGIKHWIGSKRIWKNIVGNVGDDGAAAQKRRLGRFLFACSVNEYESILKNQVSDVRRKSGNTDVTFHLFAGLAGGTGSGSIVDAIAQTRKHFVPSVGSGMSYKIIVYCLVPEHSPLPNWDKGNYHANGFAALTELNALKVRQFIPHDVSGEFEHLTYDGDNIFNSCFLFTNANENGVIVNTKAELPAIVSDLLHHYIFLQIDDNVRPFMDCYSSENVDPKDEYDENAESAEEKVRTRSKAFKTFGIKRIINPEEEIKEYLTYTFAQQALFQFKYNNWSDDLGYRDEPQNEDYHSFVNNDAFLKNISLTDAHLMLSLGILTSEIEQKWKTIGDDWGAIVPMLSTTAWTNNEAHALNELAKLCQDRYDKHFRKVGVPDFYKIKLKSKRDHAAEILLKVEKFLFSEWQSGQRSIYGIGKIIETLTDYVENNLKTFDAKIVNKEKKLEELNKAKIQNEQIWSGTGFISSLIGKKKNLFQSQTTILQSIFIVRTEIEAMHFAKELLKELAVGVNEMRNTISQLNEEFNAVATIAEQSIALRCKEKSDKEVNYSDSVIRYYNPNQVRSFADQLRRDADVQKRQSGNVRNRIVDICGTDHTFSQMVEQISEDTLIGVFENECQRAAIEAHDELTQGKSNVIVGKNIIEQLCEKFGSNDQKDALEEFARNIIRSSGVFLTFDNSEINRAIPNNVVPKQGINTMFRSVLISLPAAPGKEAFIAKLEDAFRKNIDGSKQIYFDNKSEKRNEITVLSITFCFPLRMVNDVKLLKPKYELLLKGEQKEVNELVLHLEGDGTQYPPIFVDKFDPKKFIGDLILATALKFIEFQDKQDGTGKQAYCIMKTDELGMPMPPVIVSNKLSEMHETETLKMTDLKNIKADVDAKLQGEYLHISKREELSKEIAALARVILTECNNNMSSPVYKMYYDIIKEQILKLKA